MKKDLSLVLQVTCLDRCFFRFIGFRIFGFSNDKHGAQDLYTFKQSFSEGPALLPFLQQYTACTVLSFSRVCTCLYQSFSVKGNLAPLRTIPVL